MNSGESQLVGEELILLNTLLINLSSVEI